MIRPNTRSLAAVVALGLVGTPALAAEPTLQVQASVTSVGADAFSSFASDGVLPTYGLRGTAPLTRNLSLVGGLHAGRRGLSVRDDAGLEQFRTAYTASTVLLGVQGEVQASDYFRPYLLAGALGHLGHAQFDDDPTRRDHPGQVRSTGGSLGGTVALGGTIYMNAPEASVRPILHAEFGWQGVLPHRYAEGGERMLPMGYSGVVFRTGVGVAF